MDAPRTRYKVVERGRRLEVVDTWNDDAPVRSIRAEATPPRRDGLAAIEGRRTPARGKPGQRILNTQAWYDESGPRTIALTPQGEARLSGLRVAALVTLGVFGVVAYLFWPLWLVLPFLLMNGETRKSLRAASTRVIDGLNR